MDDSRLRKLLEIAVTQLAAVDQYSAEAFGDTTFVGLGGDSLAAMRLAAEAAEALGVRLSVRALLSDHPLRRVLSDAAGQPPVHGIWAAPPERSHTARRTWSGAGSQTAQGAGLRSDAPTGLSPAQEGMWINERVVGSSPYNLVFICFLQGDLDRDALSLAVDETVARHDALRTVFLDAGGQLQRQVLEGHVPSLDWRLWSGPENAYDGHVRRTAAADGSAAFDLSDRPGLRWTVISHKAGRRHALILNVHHILLDGWAIGLVLKEIFARYDAAVEGNSLNLGPAVTFDEHLDRQRQMQSSGEMANMGLFWKESLAGAPTILELPADSARPAFTEPFGKRITIDFESALSERINDCARHLNVTTAAFFLGAYALTLSRYASRVDVIVGVPVAGRPTRKLAELVGPTMNLVPVRVRIDDNQTVREYFACVHESLSASHENGEIPFQSIVAQLGIKGTWDRHPLIQAAFSMHDGLIPQKLPSRTLDIQIEEGHGGGSQYDLEFSIRASDPAFAGYLEYATAVWGPAEAAAFRDDLLAAANDLASAPERALADVRCVAPVRKALLDRVNETVRPYPESSVDEVFRAQALRTPRATAVSDGDEALTYEELAAASSAQARLLADAGVKPGSTVLVALERSIAEAVALLGIAWAGAAYVGLDADAPRRRVDQLISTLSPAAVIGAAAEGWAGLPLVSPWSGQWPRRDAATMPALPPDPERLAYVAFTSGSQGTPKGVCVRHRGVLRLIGGLPDYAPVGPGDRVLRFSPLSFDASTFEVWGALLTGASLVVHPPALPSPVELGDFIRRRGITVAWLTSGLFSLVSQYAADSLADLRVLLTGGDVVPSAQVRRVLERHAALSVVNGYGPTENTTFTTVHRVADPGEVTDPLPIGRPIANTQVYILDERGRILPPGAVGELHVAGDGLATGYFGDSDRTAASFGEFSPDVRARLYRTGDLVRLDTAGRLQFIGRRDDQVKIRGFRVELGEIRAVLTSHPKVADAVVTVTGEESGVKRIVACCIPGAVGLVAEELSDFLFQRLPSYMVPHLWAIVAELPLTPNGKIDRIALRQAARPVAPGARLPDRMVASDLAAVGALPPQSQAEANASNLAPGLAAHSGQLPVPGA